MLAGVDHRIGRQAEDIDLSDTVFTDNAPPGTRDGTRSFADAAAAGRNGWWRYLLAVVVIVVMTFALQAGLAVVAYVQGGPSPSSQCGKGFASDWCQLEAEKQRFRSS